jgi:organic hydroperoxide reductase OsmC/OhrA
MQQYPVRFEARAEAKNGMRTAWMIQSGEFQTMCAVPPEFNGAGGGFSPEDLFAQALTNCFLATFKVYAEHSKLNYSEIIANAQLLVDLNEDRKPVMKSFQLKATIRQPSNVERAKVLAEKAMRSGFILNSVKTDLNFELTIEGDEGAQ